MVEIIGRTGSIYVSVGRPLEVGLAITQLHGLPDRMLSLRFVILFNFNSVLFDPVISRECVPETITAGVEIRKSNIVIKEI